MHPAKTLIKTHGTHQCNRSSLLLPVFVKISASDIAQTGGALFLTGNFRAKLNSSMRRAPT